MNKSDVAKLISKLANKEYCPCHPEGGENACLVKTHPVLLGDVLEKMKEKKYYDIEAGVQVIELVKIWSKCGFTKSLQDMIECGFETVCAKCGQAACWEGEFYCDNYKDADIQEQLADPNVRKLFKFINSIIND